MTWQHTGKQEGEGGQAVKFGDSPSLDSFGILRTSQPISRFDAQLTYDLQPLLYEQLTNGSGAAIAHDSTERAAVLTLSNTPNGGYAYMQSYEWAYYHPGNSQKINVTFNFRGHAANTTKLAGYGDLSNNGIHFYSDGTNLGFRILSDTSKGDESVTQANWNKDTLDGSGDENNPSGLRLDINQTQILVIDLQALYVGRIRIGFNIDGITIICHEFLHANRIAFPYIQEATLPIICGMTCSDTATTTMLFICATVRSEGSALEEEGFNFSVEGTVTAGSGARTHILSVRPNTTFNSLANRINFVLESIEILVTGNSPVLWELCVGQALTDPTYADVNTTYSGFEVATAETLSGNPAIVIAQGYSAATAANKSVFSKPLTNRYPITLDAAGAVRALGTLTLLVTGLGGTSATRASFNWREIR